MLVLKKDDPQPLGLSEEDLDFEKVLAAEHDAINARRGKQKRRSETVTAAGGTDGGGKRPVYDTTGVALSGGGIRSAAFCLGALQSLEAVSLIRGVDYLSTVSGGGYIGASMSACMSQKPETDKVQEFPFGAPHEYEDREAVGHLRDYSNYLLPRGSSSFTDIVSVLLRGWATNLIFILGIVFPLAWLTVRSYPDRSLLMHQSFPIKIVELLVGLLKIDIVHGVATFFGWFGEKPPIAHPFALTALVAASLAIVLVAWAILRSRARVQGSDVSGGMIVVVRAILWLLAAVALLEVQPVVIYGFFAACDKLVQNSFGASLAAIPAFFAPVAGIVVFFRDQLGAFLKSSESKAGTSVFLGRIAAQALIWIAALVLPLLIYAFFIWICAAGMKNGQHYSLWPGFIVGGRMLLSKVGLQDIPASDAYFYLTLAFAPLVLLFGPNANSLHQLYRDKLSKAFLFDPVRPKGSDPRDDLPAKDTIKLTEISQPTGGPYHLINAAINLQNSKYANRRGREATFFLFSSRFVGSDVTGYVDTQTMQNLDKHLDLGTAMAVSGAAVSANMGSYTIAALAPTLALLNFRLGYWLANPANVHNGASTTIWARFKSLIGIGPRVEQDASSRSWKEAARDRLKTIRRLVSDMGKFYLIAEIFGNLDETSPHVYVTDGGHIENLGLYQLLKRRCRAIVVVDAEADPGMSFHALSLVERYARIDLGVLIDLPWAGIGQPRAKPKSMPESDDPAAHRKGAPHCALGLIHYPNNEQGILLYVKASVTGDEADYVLDYKSRNPTFPHESTGDQFFSEEQFEAYRALGFHAVDNFFEAKMDFAWDPDGDWRFPVDPLSPGSLREFFKGLFA